MPNFYLPTGRGQTLTPPILMLPWQNSNVGNDALAMCQRPRPLHIRAVRTDDDRPGPGVSASIAAALTKSAKRVPSITDEFRWDCILYYLKNTGIPVNFGITITIALIVGTVVAGQTFYLFTLENLKQFGALKAIGVTNWRLTGMVLLQAFTVGVMGFGIGTGMAAAFFEMTLRKIATRGIILMWQSVALTGGCILFVVIIASLLSIRRVIVLEAATVFRG